jgi:hypothetical protein
MRNSCHKLLKKYVRSFLRTRPCIGAKGSYKYIKEIIYIFGFRSRIRMFTLYYIQKFVDRQIVRFFVLFALSCPGST